MATPTQSKPTNHRLQITMTWTTAADFDLAAVYETQTGDKGIVYFGDLGSLEKSPYIRLTGDKGVNDAAGQHEETVYIGHPEDLKTAWFFCWDYGRIQEGKAARFEDSDIKLTVFNNAGKSTVIPLDKTEPGNVCCLARLSISGKSMKFTKSNKSGILRGLYQIEQLLAVVTE